MASEGHMEHYTHDRNWGCRISDEHVFRGLRALVMENELIRVTVLLDKGSDIYEFLYKKTDTDFMWRSPNPVRDPRAFEPTSMRADGSFMDYYHGGWQEIFPGCGARYSYKGAEIGQHGEVSTIPWNCRIATDSPEEIESVLTVRTYRTPFYIEKKLRMVSGVAALFISETVVNEGREEMDFMWGHHPALGYPFIDETCRIDVPATKVEVHAESGVTSRLKPGASFESFPIIKDKEGRDFDLSAVPSDEAATAEMCYLMGLREGWFAATNQGKKIGFGMSWDKEVFPVVWLWEVFGGGFGYPWYGRTYNLALEPMTSWPGGMANALARGTTRKIGPLESISTSLTAVAYDGLTSVKRIAPDGKVEGE